MKLAKITPLLPAVALLGVAGGVGFYFWNRGRAAPAKAPAPKKPGQPAPKPDAQNCKIDPKRGIKVCEMEPLTQVDVLIDPGHSTVEEGFVSGNIKESVEARRMADTLATELKALMPGIKIQLTHNGQGLVSGKDGSAEINARVAMIKKVKPRVLISLHYDWPQGRSAVIYPNDARPKSVALARRMGELLGGIRVTDAQSYARFKTLGVLDNHKEPVAVLWEIDTIHTAKNTKEYRLSFAKPAAKAIVEALRS